MSLRDQLLQKGLASKKDARRVEQELQRERREREGARRSKAEEESDRNTRESREAAEHLAARLAARSAYQEARERTERALQIRNLILSNALRGGGPVAFFHRVPSTSVLGAVHVSVLLAHQLKRGDVAIAALPAAVGFDFRIVRRSAAERLFELSPQLLVFWNRDPSGTLAADQQPAERNWETALGAHRATEADLKRLRLAAEASAATAPSPPSRGR